MHYFKNPEYNLLFSHKNYFCTIFYRIAHLCELKQNSILKKHGLTHQQTQILAFIHARKDYDAVLQRDIEKEFFFKSSTVTGLLNTLEKDGYIQRLPCANDRRAKRLVVTDKATSLHEAFLDSLQQVDDLIKENFSPEEQEVLHGNLLKIYDGSRAFFSE